MDERTLEQRVKELEALAQLGMTVITNSEPHNSLNAAYRERYWMAMQSYLDTFHKLGLQFTEYPATPPAAPAGTEAT
jgi:hypothetical protein